KSKSDIRTRYRSAACTAISLNNVTIKHDLALAQQSCIDDRAQAAADQTLYLLRTARWTLGLTLRARICSTRQHCVFCGDPADALVSHKHWYAFFDRGGANYLCAADLDERRALGIWRNIWRYLCITELVDHSTVKTGIIHRLYASLWVRLCRQFILSKNLDRFENRRLAAEKSFGDTSKPLGRISNVKMI